MLAVIIHDVIGSNESGNVSTGFFGKIRVNGPIVFASSGTVNGFVERSRSAIISGNYKIPITVNLVKIIKILRGGKRSFYGVAAFINKTVNLLVVAFCCGQHKLP